MKRIKVRIYFETRREAAKFDQIMSESGWEPRGDEIDSNSCLLVIDPCNRSMMEVLRNFAADMIDRGV